MRTAGTAALRPTEGVGLEEVAPARQRSDAESRSARVFAPGLWALAVLAIVLRVAYAVTWENGKPLRGDPGFFQSTAASIFKGNGYVTPLFGNGPSVPTALHPPVFSIVLAFFDLVRAESADAHRIALAFLAAGSVVAMGLLGRRLLGPATGLLAAACAAVSPLWIQWGGRLLSESVYLIVIPVLLLVAIECVDRPSWWIFGSAGLMTGIAALTRSEAIGFVVLLGVPLVLVASRQWRRRATYGLAFLAGVVLIVGPWVIRNEIQLGGFVLSTDSGTTLVGANTPNTYAPANPLYGSFDGEAQFGAAYLLLETKPPDHAPAWTERTMSAALGDLGKRYALSHLRDLPGVVLAREGRLWGVYSPGTQLQNDSGDGGQVTGFYVAGDLLEWAALPLAIAGGVFLFLRRRSRKHLVVLAVPIVLAALDAALFFGSTRLRAVAEPSLFLLSSVAIVEISRRLRASTSPGAALEP
jgi:4-amino-4-deoxy-L-arabinose transferase-like glycosyltransferase